MATNLIAEKIVYLDVSCISPPEDSLRLIHTAVIQIVVTFGRPSLFTSSLGSSPLIFSFVLLRFHIFRLFPFPPLSSPITYAYVFSWETSRFGSMMKMFRCVLLLIKTHLLIDDMKEVVANCLTVLMARSMMKVIRSSSDWSNSWKSPSASSNSCISRDFPAPIFVVFSSVFKTNQESIVSIGRKSFGFSREILCN